MKYKILNKLVVILSVLVFVGFSFETTVMAAVNTPTRSVVQNTAYVSPVAVVSCPEKYLNKTIAFDAEFISYSSLGLDYKPALRESSKYIGVLIKRDDVKDHVIPLSEMKLFLKREMAEKNADLENGDKVKITGTVFSTALGDPWVDIKTFNVVTKKNKDK